MSKTYPNPPSDSGSLANSNARLEEDDNVIRYQRQRFDPERVAEMNARAQAEKEDGQMPCREEMVIPAVEKVNSVNKSIIVSVLIIAISIIASASIFSLANRYSMVSGDRTTAYKLDKITGDVSFVSLKAGEISVINRNMTEPGNHFVNAEWYTILADMEFNKQPLETKRRVAENYFQRRIAPNLEFQEQSKEVRRKVYDAFMATVLD